jgi:hypothetical protein
MEIYMDFDFSLFKLATLWKSYAPRGTPLQKGRYTGKFNGISTHNNLGKRRE